MKTLTTAKQLFQYIQTSEWKNLYQLLDENFLFTGHTPRPLDKHEFIMHYKELTRAFTNWNYNVGDLIEYRPNQAEGTIKLSCHHTGTYYGKMWNTPILFPTLKYITLPREKFELSVKEGFVLQLVCYPEASGGISGLIKEAGEKISAI